ncbi:Required for respiratory growth protein 9 mitochondrial [Monascus purpureus]|uniref:Required for respiratory growth protein 9, mitochondrial n=1 Tax=Monascus purpureus TaxID=5098 RepID=A0A507R055_MONPU|nr:Required for respiratory growth protein 9 mitochondrial [Monascus purpureus]BDD60763.1 hypothetical protein MAP00_005861 [Monascus purpureus]
MSQFCAASSRLSLGAVLHSVFRAELASLNEYPSRLFYRGPSSLSRSLRTRRCFNSFSRLQNSHSKKVESGSQGLTTTADATSNAGNQHSTPRDTTDTTTGSNHDTVSEAPSPAKGDLKLGGSNDQNHSSGKSTAAKKSSQKDKDRKVTRPKQKEKKPEGWQIQKAALKEKFKEGWNPPKKLSPDAIEGIRHLHATAPDKFTTPVLAEEFKVSPEAIRRILKSKWRASGEEMEERQKRWQRRYDRIWSQMAELGLRPKRKRTEAVSDIKVLYGDKKAP